MGAAVKDSLATQRRVRKWSVPTFLGYASEEKKERLCNKAVEKRRDVKGTCGRLGEIAMLQHVLVKLMWHLLQGPREADREKVGEGKKGGTEKVKHGPAK